MKPLSEALLDLAGRVQKLEASAKSDRDADRAELERSLEEISAALDAGVADFEAAAREADARGSKWWDETRTSTARQLEDARARYQREAQDQYEKAHPTGNVAEVDANAAVALANYAVTAAQYSIADAALKGLTGERPAPPAAAATS